MTTLLVGALVWLGLGCEAGCRPATPAAPTASAEAAAPQPTESDTDADDVGDTEEVPLLPVLNREALSARVEAQRAVLGSRATLFEDAEGHPVPWLSPQGESPTGGEPSVDDQILDSLPGSSGLGGAGEGTGPQINGNTLGLFEPVKGATERKPLDHFYGALRNLAARDDEDGKVRVLVYGGSHTDADVYPHYLRKYLQERFGNGGHGFVHVAKPWRWYRHIDMQVEGYDGWFTEHAQRAKARDDGYYGLLGASLSTKSKKAFGRISPRKTDTASVFDLYYLRQPKGGSFRVLVDGKAVETVKTRAKDFEPGYRTIRVPEAQHTVEVQPIGNGEVRLFGMTAENDQAGVVVDTLGIGGARASNMLRWDEAVWTDNVRRRAPDLIVLAYGTNEATDADQRIGRYESTLRAVIARLRRAAPQASCLLVGPGDFPLKVADGQYIPRPRLAQVVEVQARVATESGCAFWDFLAFMGGQMSMVRWAGATPRMAKDDHIHLTRRGYVRMGMGLVDALMQPFDG